jgi:multidrug transporter EmrE-like cation transporter
MIQRKFKALIFGFSMALIDAIALSLLKLQNTQQKYTNTFFVIAMIIYAFQPIIFYKGLAYAPMSILNILWDLFSDLIVCIIGFLVFKENLTTQQYVGVVLAFISILLLSS